MPPKPPPPIQPTGDCPSPSCPKPPPSSWLGGQSHATHCRRWAGLGSLSLPMAGRHGCPGPWPIGIHCATLPITFLEGGGAVPMRPQPMPGWEIYPIVIVV